jgi:hypothetical protein
MVQLARRKDVKLVGHCTIKISFQLIARVFGSGQLMNSLVDFERLGEKRQ